MTYFVKIYTDPAHGSSKELLNIIPALQSRFPGIPFEVLESPIPEISSYPRLIVWGVNDEGRFVKRLELRGYRTEAEVVGCLASILESKWACQLAS
jgi:hypothetical protein